jgi:hypothetical protein
MRLSCFFVCVGFSFLLGRAGAQSELPANSGSSNGLIRRTPESLEKERQAECHIILDVVVTDPSGKPVSGLRQQDFTLQDGAIQEPFRSFEAVNGSTARPPVQIIIVLDTMMICTGCRYRKTGYREVPSQEWGASQGARIHRVSDGH